MIFCEIRGRVTIQRKKIHSCQISILVEEFDKVNYLLLKG